MRHRRSATITIRGIASASAAVLSAVRNARKQVVDSTLSLPEIKGLMNSIVYIDPIFILKNHSTNKIQVQNISATDRTSIGHFHVAKLFIRLLL